MVMIDYWPYWVVYICNLTSFLLTWPYISINLDYTVAHFSPISCINVNAELFF